MAEHLSPSETDVMRVLARRERDLTATEVAERSGLKPGTVSNALTRLLRRGLVMNMVSDRPGTGRNPAVWWPSDAGYHALRNGRTGTEAMELARKLEMKAHGGPNHGCDCLLCEITMFLRGTTRAR